MSLTVHSFDWTFCAFEDEPCVVEMNAEGLGRRRALLMLVG